MAETPAITDRNLEAATHISLKREPACFAFLSARSIAPPTPIDSINLDLGSADYFNGRAPLWTTPAIPPVVTNHPPGRTMPIRSTRWRRRNNSGAVAPRPHRFSCCPAGDPGEHRTPLDEPDAARFAGADQRIGGAGRFGLRGGTRRLHAPRRPAL